MRKSQLDKLEVISSIFINNDPSEGYVHEYDILHSDDLGKTIIARSQGKQWAEDARGSFVGSLWDNGNEVHINIEGKEIELDYAQMEALTSIILACNDYDVEVRKFKTISKISNLK
jgi:hypothetical protein